MHLLPRPQQHHPRGPVLSQSSAVPVAAAASVVPPADNNNVNIDNSNS